MRVSHKASRPVHHLSRIACIAAVCLGAWAAFARAGAVAPASAPADHGRGLRAEFFRDHALSAKVGERVEPNIDYIFGDGSPTADVPVDDFTIRWSGFIKAPRRGTYRLVTHSDDGARVWIDDRLMLDRWPGRGRSEALVDFTGEPQAFRMEYLESGGGGNVTLLWADANTDDWAVIPPECFFRDKEVAAKMKVSKEWEPEKGRGLDVIFTDRAGKRKFGSRCDFDLSWFGRGAAIAPGVPKDQFGARWTGYLKAPQRGNYRIIVHADDGVRVWLDDVKIIDDWRGGWKHPEVVVALDETPRALKVDYFEIKGDAWISLNWATLDGKIPQQPIPPSAFFTEKAAAEGKEDDKVTR